MRRGGRPVSGGMRYARWEWQRRWRPRPLGSAALVLARGESRWPISLSIARFSRGPGAGPAPEAHHRAHHARAVRASPPPGHHDPRMRLGGIFNRESTRFPRARVRSAQVTQVPVVRAWFCTLPSLARPMPLRVGPCSPLSRRPCDLSHQMRRSRATRQSPARTFPGVNGNVCVDVWE